MANVVLSILAHPDDAEFLCAGTLIRLVREHGWQAHIASMTPGDCGSAERPPDEIARTRRAEGAAAAAKIGATYHCVEERDLLIFYAERPLERVTRLLREVRPRVVLENFVLNGIGTLQYTGTSILMSWPETGGLVTEYDLAGRATRTFGELRRTGHEDDRELHLALNAGIPLVDPTGGFLFVFQTGEPVFRKYDPGGRLVFERRIQGQEIDRAVADLPTTWPRRKSEEGELPLVRPTVRTAAVDRTGHLWVSFVVPYTYVFDSDGDKARTLQFLAAGIVAPNGLFFGKDDRILVTPGLFSFQAGSAGAAGRSILPRVPPVQPVLPIPPSASQ